MFCITELRIVSMLHVSLINYRTFQQTLPDALYWPIIHVPYYGVVMFIAKFAEVQRLAAWICKVHRQLPKLVRSNQTTRPCNERPSSIECDMHYLPVCIDRSHSTQDNHL